MNEIRPTHCIVPSDIKDWLFKNADILETLLDTGGPIVYDESKIENTKDAHNQTRQKILWAATQKAQENKSGFDEKVQKVCNQTIVKTNPASCRVYVYG